MSRIRRRLQPVLVVRSDGSVGLRMGVPTMTRGLVAVPDCPRCCGRCRSGHHDHRGWRIQTTSGYLLGDFSSSRADALGAAAALGALDIDWQDPRLPTRTDDYIRQLVSQTLARWGVTRAA